MKLGAIVWTSFVSLLARASKKVEGLECTVFSSRDIEENPEILDAVLRTLERQDIVFLYRSTESFWGTIENRLKDIGKKVPVVSLGHDPSYWMFSTVNSKIVAAAYSYIVNNGEENFINMLKYLCRELGGADFSVEPPKKIAWEGLYHPDAPGCFKKIEEYLNWYRFKNTPTVGMLFSRHSWVNDNLEVEDELIRQLEKQGLNVIPAFSYSLKDEEKGCRGSDEVVREYFLRPDRTSRIDGLIKLQPFLLGSGRKDRRREKEAGDAGVRLLKELDVPVFCPFHSYYKTRDEWKEDPQGLAASHIGWQIAMPEFEGVIEPVIVSAAARDSDRQTGATLERKMPIEERCRRVALRIANWIRLKNKPIEERRIAFILHSNPCASVEATVGGGSQLDTLESVAGIMHRMKEKGYGINPPADGKELINTIMERKAISEFRWTTVEEIVAKGGVLAQISREEYEIWFNTLSPEVRKRMCEAWGRPPGEEINGVPSAMVYNGKILVTGVRYGNAVVCIQPKRGCAGARCDGEVCKILHDPDIPPPHQYMATYRYLEHNFGVDAIVHVGTHGNLEFLPGKGIGLSGDCFPDIAIGNIPHLYIYNADNPPEGTIAKRRSYAALVDHMQTVMIQGGLYEELEELNRFLGEYAEAKALDPSRAHALEHLIIEKIEKTSIDKEIKFSEDMPFDEIVRRAHEVLSRTRNTRIQDGLHIFGQVPEGERRIDFINSILRYDAGKEVSLRKIAAGMLGMDLSDMLADGGKVCPHHKRSYGELLEEVNEICKSFIRYFLNGSRRNVNAAREILAGGLKNNKFIKALPEVKERILDLNKRIDESREIESLLHGFSGGYIPPGPSGLITRGRDDILPTGRNFYSLDPQRVPTKAAWNIGQKLANALIHKHVHEQGRFPENVAIYWMAGDIMYADGEGMAQIMHLLGVRPVWQPNGRIKGFEVMPLEELSRPRIDVTIRVSGITRDNFPNCIELIDEAIQAVALLDEPEEMNFIRKHTLAQLKREEGRQKDKKAMRDATLRIFCAKPGTYQAGTQLAVYASAWKEEKDLSDVFVYWNGYAYGKGIFGQEKHRQLIENLRTVDITYNKVVTDEKDLFGCCCYFGAHGGMTAASRNISGKDVKTYYGDTREPGHIEVRDMADEIRRVVRTKLLNPKWIEGMKRHGYKGASDISKRIGRVYGWEATTREVDDWIFDDIARTFILDKEMRKFFEENNPWALEEVGRRLLEAHQRGLWDADPDVIEGLKNTYLEIESWLEEKMGDVKGDFQGGSIDILISEEIKEKLTGGIKR